MPETPTPTGSPHEEPEPDPEALDDEDDENMTLYLARKAKRGDREALGELIEMQLPWLRRKVSRKIETRLRAALDTDDVVAYGYEAIARQIGSLDPLDEKGVQNWLLKIAERSLSDRRKRENADKRDRRRQVGMFWHGPKGDESEGLHPLDQDQTGPLTRVARAELREKIAEEVHRLSDEQRQIIQLRDEQQLSWDEVQSRSGATSPGAARVKYHRAWQQIRDAVLRRYEAEEGP